MKGLVGSTATTPTVRPSARNDPMSRSTSVLFPAPGGPVTPIEIGPSGSGEELPHQLVAGRRLVFDQGNRASDGPGIAREDARGERSICHWPSSWRAMTSRWISLVPSPMVRSFTSRKYFSAG